MKEWKMRREMFYSSKQNFDDLLEDTSLEIHESTDEEDIVNDAIRYLTEHRESLYYPGKSFAVAIVYAILIKEHFNEDFYETLSDPELLFDDPYFQTYMDAKDVYDSIIDQIPDYHPEDYDTLPYLSRTVEYFYEEFLLDEDEKLFI